MAGKIGSLILVLVLMISTLGMVNADSSPIRILQNGQVVQFSQDEGQVVIDENGRTLVPIRKISELLGAEVGWKSETQTVTVKKGTTLLEVAIGSTSIRSSGKSIPMDTAAKIIHGRTYVPFRAIFENLGYRIIWDPAARTISFEAVSGALAQLDKPVSGDTVARMKTSMGEIHVKLLKKEAPKAVENFIGLAQKGYFDNLTFHRVIPDFMIQGGDPNGNGTGGTSLWGDKFADEFSPDAHNFRGALSMANSGPNTNGSQFFVVQLPAGVINADMVAASESKAVKDAYLRLGGTPWLDGKHTVFGQVYEGMAVVDAIASVKTGAGDKPVEPITILSIGIETIN